MHHVSMTLATFPASFYFRLQLKVGSILLASLLLYGCQSNQGDFPQVDPAKLRIELQRSACYGSCPDYKVTIDGNGSVTFTTATRPTDPVSGLHRKFSRSNGIVVGGTHHAQIDKRQVMALLERARALNFFGLKSEYRADITDSATHVVMIDTGHGAKLVTDYVGLSAGMPQGVKDLEDAIDEVAGTKRWIEGTPQVIPLLQNEKTDFAGPVGAALMSANAARDDVATMRRLRSLGAPAGYDPLASAADANALPAARYLVSEGATNDKDSHRDAIQNAVRSDNYQMFRFLLGGGGSALLGKVEATRLLPAAAENGNLAISTFLISAGADMRGPQGRGTYYDPPIFRAARGGFEPETTNERFAIVALLLKHGANIHQCSLSCSSVLSLVSDPLVARQLIGAGADPNFMDEEGEHILFSIYYEDVALELIRAGARLNVVRPADKMTLRKWAVYQKWPRVLALLSQRGL
jgi:hypothetical protein